VIEKQSATADSSWQPSSSHIRREGLEIRWPSIEGPVLTTELVRNAEAILGVRLPASYLALMHLCNGGYLHADLGCPTATPNSSAADHVTIDAIDGICPALDCSPNESGRSGLGVLATAYLVHEWGLPSGVVLLDGDGPTWIAHDYRSCGPAGEPSVVWLDVDGGEHLELAPNFAAFWDGLRPFRLGSTPRPGPIRHNVE
jgi:SMI1-KNR4 cell-wall